MKVGLAQIEVVPGQPEVNLATCLEFQKRAFDAGAEIVAFPELCLSGYLIGDLWEEESFVGDCIEMGRELAAASRAGVTCFGNVGVETNKRGEDGRPRRYNAAWISAYGVLLDHPTFHLPFFPKTLLPNYREFEETRHFYDARRLCIEREVTLADGLKPVSVKLPSGESCIGVYLCEDGWHDDYGINVPAMLAEKGAKVLVNLSASPFTLAKEQKRHRVFSKQAQVLKCPIIYVNCVGMQNNAKTLFSFDGHSTAYDNTGGVLLDVPAFESTLGIADLSKKGEAVNNGTSPSDVGLCPGVSLPGLQNIDGTYSFAPEATPRDRASSDDSGRIYACLKNTLGKYMDRFGLQRVVIGVSGGIDSAVAAAFFTDLLGPQNVLLVNMPSVYNTATTKGLAAELMENLNTWRAHIPIDGSVKLTTGQVDGLTIERLEERQTLTLTSFHLENVQARDRTSRILAAVASAFGGVFTTNANKAETMVGYATLYGDHAGFIAPLADLWKHQVYALGQYLNRDVFNKEVIPKGIFDVRPSAELSHAQNPEEGGGDPLVYGYHDKLFERWMQHWRRCSPEEILNWYAEGTLEETLGLSQSIDAVFPTAEAFIEDLERWWSLFKGLGVIKRLQAPPIVAVCRRAFGFDYRESILTPYYSRAYLRKKEALLSHGMGTDEMR